MTNLLITISNTATYIDWTLALTLSFIGVLGSPFIVGLWKMTKRRTAKVEALYDAVLGADATLESPYPEPGIISRLDKLEADVAAVKKEVTPNGGQSQSIGDRVKRIENAINNSQVRT